MTDASGRMASAGTANASVRALLLGAFAWLLATGAMLISREADTIATLWIANAC